MKGKKSVAVWIMVWLLVASSIVRGQGDLERTVITSDTMEMRGSAERNYFTFRGGVQVRGTNLEIRCDLLTVIAGRGGDAVAEQVVGEFGALEAITAVGNVEIHQAGRSAYAGRAEVDPRAGTVVLKDGPKVVDGEVEVTGYQFVLHRGERKFEVIPAPDGQGGAGRSTVRLGAMPDLGFEQDEAALRAQAEAAVEGAKEGEDAEGGAVEPEPEN